MLWVCLTTDVIQTRLKRKEKQSFDENHAQKLHKFIILLILSLDGFELQFAEPQTFVFRVCRYVVDTVCGWYWVYTVPDLGVISSIESSMSIEITQVLP